MCFMFVISPPILGFSLLWLLTTAPGSLVLVCPHFCVCLWCVCVRLSWDVFVCMCLFVMVQHPQILDSMASHCSDCWQLTPAPLCLSIQALPGLCSLQSRCFEIFQNISRDEMMISKGLRRLQSRYFQKRGEMVPGNNPKYILTSKITQGPIIFIRCFVFW